MALLVPFLILQDNASLSDLLQRLDDDDPEVRDAAVIELARRGEGIIPQLEEARRSAGAEVAGRIGEVLARIRWHEDTVWVQRHAVNIRTGTAIWGLPDGEDARRLESLPLERDVIVSDAKGGVTRRSLKDGTIVWRADALKETDCIVGNRRIPPRLFLAGGTLLAFSQLSICGLDPGTGKLRWSEKTGLDSDPRSPALANLPLAVSEKSFFLKDACWDVLTGKKLWFLEKKVLAAGFLSDGDAVIGGEDRLARLARNDGKPVWEAEDRADVIHTVGSFVLTPSGFFDAPTGQKKWTAKWLPDVIRAVSPDGTRVVLSLMVKYIVKPRGGPCVWVTVPSVRLLDTTDWSEPWTRDFSADRCTVALDGDSLFVSDYSLNSPEIGLQRLDLKTGNDLWKAADVSGAPVNPPDLPGRRVQLVLKGPRIAVLDTNDGGCAVQTFERTDGRPVSTWPSP